MGSGEWHRQGVKGYRGVPKGTEPTPGGLFFWLAGTHLEGPDRGGLDLAAAFAGVVLEQCQSIKALAEARFGGHAALIVILDGGDGATQTKRAVPSQARHCPGWKSQRRALS